MRDGLPPRQHHSFACVNFVGVLKYRPLEFWGSSNGRTTDISGTLCVNRGDNLGIGATAARYALDVEIGVRIPDPQQQESRLKEGGFSFIIIRYYQIGQSGPCTSSISSGRS